MTSDQLILKQSLNELMGSRLSRLEVRASPPGNVPCSSPLWPSNTYRYISPSYIVSRAYSVDYSPALATGSRRRAEYLKKRRVTFFLDKKYIAGKTYLSISDESLTKKKRGLEVILSTRTRSLTENCIILHPTFGPNCTSSLFTSLSLLLFFPNRQHRVYN